MKNRNHTLPTQLAINLKEQLYETLTDDQKKQFMQLIIALDNANPIIGELIKADSIISICLNLMTETQRLEAVYRIRSQGISEGWAFRHESRKEKIARGKRIFAGVKNA